MHSAAETFNRVTDAYDRLRPGYCPALFEQVFDYSGIDSKSEVLEIGPGTGQATEPFLKAGCSVTAVEPGESLAQFCREKFKERANLEVVTSLFEETSFSNERFDLIFSATAFHWVSEETGYPKVKDYLKKGGTLALFWNRPFVSRTDDPLHCEIQKVYKELYRGTAKVAPEHDEERYRRISKTITNYGFVDAEVKLFHRTREVSADDFVALLKTYSDHQNLPEMFFVRIHDAVSRFGGVLHIYDTMDLYLAKKAK